MAVMVLAEWVAKSAWFGAVSVVAYRVQQGSGMNTNTSYRISTTTTIDMGANWDGSRKLRSFGKTLHSGLTLDEAASLIKQYTYTPRFEDDYTHWIEPE